MFIFTLSLLSSVSLCCLCPPAEACGSKSVYDGPEQEEYSSFVIDDPQETYKTLKLIVSAVQTLEQQHTKYKRDKFKKTRIGSQYVVCLIMFVKLQLLCVCIMKCRLRTEGKKVDFKILHRIKYQATSFLGQ